MTSQTLPQLLEPIRKDLFTMEFLDQADNTSKVPNQSVKCWKLYTENNLVYFKFKLRVFVNPSISPKNILAITQININFEDPAAQKIRAMNLILQSIGFELEGDYESSDILTYKVCAIVKQTKCS